MSTAFATINEPQRVLLHPRGSNHKHSFWEKCIMADGILAEIKAAKKPLYVYILSKPDGTPFYVGKGKGRRLFEHEKDARKTNRRSHKLSIIRKILRSGCEVAYSIDSWHDTDQSACDREVSLISEIGRYDLGTGPLTNYTSGGDTPEVGPLSRMRLSASQKRYFATPGSREKTATAMKKYLQEHPDAMDAHAKKITEFFSVPENRQRQSQALRAFFAKHPEAGPAHSARLKQMYRDNPEMLEKLNRKRAEVATNPSTRKKMSESNKRWRLENPEACAARQIKSAATRSTPESRRGNTARKRAWNSANPGKVAKIVDNLKRHRSAASAIRQRCLLLIKDRGLLVKPPDGRASVSVWQQFESQIMKECSNAKVA